MTSSVVTRAAGAMYSKPALSPDGATVYFGSLNKWIYAHNAANGTERWSCETGGQVRASPILFADGATMYVGALDTPNAAPVGKGVCPRRRDRKREVGVRDRCIQL